MSTQQLDTTRLADYLRQHIPGFSGDMIAEKFAGGQSNPTFKLTAGGTSYVLRRKPPGELLPSAHAVDREYRVITALADTEVPVPKTYALCEDESVIGSMFYVMECVEGRILWDPLLPEARSNEDRAAYYDAMNQTMAALHNVDIEAVGLTDYGKPATTLNGSSGAGPNSTARRKPSILRIWKPCLNGCQPTCPKTMALSAWCTATTAWTT